MNKLLVWNYLLCQYLVVVEPKQANRPSVEVTSRSLLVSWPPLLDDREGEGPVIHYKVYWRTATVHDKWTNQAEVGRNATSYTIQPVEPNTDYAVAVAVVRAGDGDYEESPKSPIVAVKTGCAGK